jgi:hypothetical protein
MNEIIMAGSDYGNNALGGIGIVGIIFGAAWLLGLFGKSVKEEKSKKGKK